MKQVTYSEARRDLSNLINIAYTDNIPIYIERKNGARVVIINADDFEIMDETRYLCQNGANLKHIESAISNFETQNNVRKVSDIKELF